MKTNLGKALLGILGIAVLATGLTGCVLSARGHLDVPVLWVDVDHHSVSRDYYYYPDAQVYFDPGVRFYYWRDGGEWRHGPRVPGGVVLRSESRVRFRSDAEQPYRVHDRVVQRFRSTEDRRGPAMQPRGERR